MTSNDRRGSPVLDGVETAVAPARVAVSSPTRSAFQRGPIQTFTPRANFVARLAPQSRPALRNRTPSVTPERRPRGQDIPGAGYGEDANVANRRLHLAQHAFVRAEEIAEWATIVAAAQGRTWRPTLQDGAVEE